MEAQQLPRLAPFNPTKNGADPGPRCGHSLTAVAVEQGPLLILFGGATALEGTGANSGSSGIRLAGATADVHSFSVKNGEWQKLEPVGEAPSPRAAHAAAAVGSMVVIQGGIGPSGLATEDLHVLDLSSSPARWHRVVVPQSGPGPRYAHTLALVAQRYLVCLGGNDGRTALSDVWALDTAAKPYKWGRVEAQGEGPVSRMYATAAARSDGLLLLTGGREANNAPLGDAFGLARHRDGRWEWARAPGVSPSQRYQHASVFVGAKLHVNGGALGGGRMVDNNSAWTVLDTEAGKWSTWEGPEMASVAPRCRHALASVGPLLFLYGGLRGGTLLDDMIVADDKWAEPGRDRWEAITAVCAANSAPPWVDWVEAMGLLDTISPSAAPSMAHQHAPGASHDSPHTPAHRNQVLQEAAEAEAQVAAQALASTSGARPMEASRGPWDGVSTPVQGTYMDEGPPSRPYSAGGSAGPIGADGKPVGETPPTPDVRLHNRVVVVAAGRSPAGQGGNQVAGLVRQLSLDQFENEGRRVGPQGPGDMDAPPGTSGVEGMVGIQEEVPGYSPLERVQQGTGVHKMVISHLLRPREWTAPVNRTFFMDLKEIEELCNLAEAIFQEEPTVLHLHAPVKIFGDLHGQFADLMRLFDEYGTPSTAGDIAYIDYLFLGDYVDRGTHSLETIMLLLALKVEHPRSVHLIRGNHEAADINAQFGFRLECVERLGEQGLWVWQRLNSLFNFLPLAALIERKILCMHGGIGRGIETISEIEAVQRPVTMETGGMLLMDLLWSDPTESDRVEGVHPNARGPGLVSFGPDRVHRFCEVNDVQLLVRAHECVMDGFERFAQGHLITVFSATNYCGTANNAGAILVVGRDLVVVPKLIHPLPPQALHEKHEAMQLAGSPGQLAAPPVPTPADPWLESLNKERPPTPPRGRPTAKTGNEQRNSLAWI